MGTVASLAQIRTRGKREKPRDPDELKEIYEAVLQQDDLLAKAILAEFDEFVNAEGHRDRNGRILWNEPIIRSLGGTALATLRYKARRGCTVSAIFLAKCLLGNPDLPFSERVDKMTEEQALAKMREIAGPHLTAETVEAIIGVFAAPPPPALP